MLKVDTHNNITLTRGDTALLTIALIDIDGQDYTPPVGSTLRFVASKKYGAPDSEVLIEIQIPIDTMILEIKPSDTKDLPFATYHYDVELTDNVGHVSTAIQADLIVAKEVN